MADIEQIIVHPNVGFDTGETAATKLNAVISKVNSLPPITATETQVLFKGAADAEGDSAFTWNKVNKILNLAKAAPTTFNVAKIAMSDTTYNSNSSIEFGQILANPGVQFFKDSSTIGGRIFWDGNALNLHAHFAKAIGLSANQIIQDAVHTNGLYTWKFAGIEAMRLTGGMLGIGITPTAKLHIKGFGTTSGTKALSIVNSAGTPSLEVGDDNSLRLYNNSYIYLERNIDSSMSNSPRIVWGGNNMGSVYMYGDQHRLHVVGAGGIFASSINVPRFITTDSNGGTLALPLIGMTNGVSAGIWFIRDAGGGDGGYGGIGFSYNLTVNSAPIEGFRLNSKGNTVFGGSPTNIESAKVIINSTTKGFLPPRMTGTQVEAIASPAEGLMAYATNAGAGDITAKGWWGYNGTNWEKLNN